MSFSLKRLTFFAADGTFKIEIQHSLREKQAIPLVSWETKFSLFQHLSSSPPRPPAEIRYGESQTLAWYDNSWYDIGLCSGYMAVKTPNGYLAVAVTFRGELLEIGTDPEYYVCWGTHSEFPLVLPFVPGWTEKWTLPVKDAAEKWKFPDEVGWRVTIEPVKTTKSLDISVNIQDLSK